MDASPEKKELVWVNNVKFICLILVFLTHSESYTQTWIEGLIYYYQPFFTNAFFLVSGYLLFRKQLSNPLVSFNRVDYKNAKGGSTQLLSNIIFKIALPTLLFAILIFFPKQLIRGEGITIKSFLNDTILGGSMWFTCALTIAEICIWILLTLRVRNTWHYVIFGIILTFLANVCYDSIPQIMGNPKIPWSYKSGFIVVLFMALGGVYFSKESIIDKILMGKRSKLILSFSVLFIVLFIFLLEYKDYYKVIRTINWSLADGHMNIPSLIWILIVNIIFIYLCKLIKGGKLSNWVGRNSIKFYVICGAIPNAISVLFHRFLPQITGVILPVLVWLFSMLSAFLIVIIVDRFLPFLFDMRLLLNRNITSTNLSTPK